MISNLTHKRRGGTFFTMTIFIMMLISVALMYYYFQRTRMLQKEVTALRNGETPANDGISGWLNWSGDSQKPTDSAGAVTSQPAPSPTPITQPTPPPAPPPVSSGTLTLDQLQPAATPQAIPPDTILPEAEASPAPESRKPSLAPDAEQPAEDSPDETPAPPKKIESIYDDPNAAPSVRVRTPQRR